MESADFPDLIRALSQNYGLETTPGFGGFEELKVLLAKALKGLIQSNPEKLLTIMYRLDINEALFRQAMETGSEQNQAEAIANLVLERELKRLEFRKKYKPPTDS